MSILQQLLALKQEQAEQISEDELLQERSDLMSLIEKWQDRNKSYSFEGYRGVQRFVELLRVMGGYRDLDDFFADNSGAVEAVLQWAADRNVDEWEENLKSELGDDGDDDEDHDGDEGHDTDHDHE